MIVEYVIEPTSDRVDASKRTRISYISFCCAEAAYAAMHQQIKIEPRCASGLPTNMPNLVRIGGLAMHHCPYCGSVVMRTHTTP